MDWKIILHVVVEVLDLVGPFIILFFMFAAYRYQSKTVLRIIERQKHLHLLMDILASGVVVPPVRDIYKRAREAGPGCDMNKISQEASLENFNSVVQKLHEMLNRTEDPVRRARLEKMIQEIEGMWNILSTLDENSSEEYGQQVMMDMQRTIHKMVSEGLADIGGFE